ncbi:MAG: hypothetical protein CVU38_20195 [Chloroflexi bacterium HGW-Chloroflexi-1]|nr:MAG: hypothetical protein CVU38_20195 [Chloroflexi bacterium HGW-Chloroflexi-1]
MMKTRLLLVIALLAALVGVAGPAAANPAAPAAAADCNIWWNEVLHDTFDSDYRSIVGPTTPGNTVRLRLRVAQSDITSARVRVWDDRTNTATYHAMAWDETYDTDPTTYDWWYADVAVGAQPTILYYFFDLNDIGDGACTADQDFYVDDDVKFYGGGYGVMSDGWMQQATVYQIFPDRFRDGDPTNNPPAGRFFYDEAGGALVRSGQADWNYTICDPRSTYSPACAARYSSNFYGGDLQGITEKIDAGYFEGLGVTVLYLNPIFRSPSNHKYDTADYLTIDPDFGTRADFDALVAAADAHGIEIILDGVFNHTSSDSAYFDRYARYDASGNLTSPGGIGSDDNSGACESPNSAYRDWYYIPDSLGSPGNDPADRCDADDTDDPAGAWTETYSAWWGYGSLPKLQANSAAVRDLIWDDGLSSVGPYWINEGASGWRFDVGDEIDPGLTDDPSNDYWEGFRTAVRNVKSDTLMLGEVWGDASAFLLGNEWDSVMNYRFRSTMLSWLFTGCAGDGCTGGVTFEDNDSNSASASGAISAISPSEFNARLRSIQEDYPPMAWKAMMNLAGSHDTNRLRFLLRKINVDSDSAAVQRMKEWWLFAFTYTGAPTLYYGDEVGLSHDGVWSNGKWEDDPYNRAPFPWSDAGGSSYSADTADLLPHVRKMACIRQNYPALQDGDVQHGLIIDDANKVYGFARTDGSRTALIALNRDGSAHDATFSGLAAAPYNLSDGAVLLDALNGGAYTVSGGSVTVTVNSNWGVVLLEQAELSAPAANTASIVRSAVDEVTLSWMPVCGATNYEVHRDDAPYFTPSGGSKLADVAQPAFDTPGNADSTVALGNVNTNHYYVIQTTDCVGQTATSTRVGEFDFAIVAGSP